MGTPHEILDLALQTATNSLTKSIVEDETRVEQIEYVCRNPQNRAGVRVLLACLLAKIHRPEVDIRKPYTEIGGDDTFSGRSYDEGYITAFIIQHDLPCNHTTAFLTPALRNRNVPLTLDLNLVGRPARLYEAVLSLLDAVHRQAVAPESLLAETMRWLLIVREERKQRIASLLAQLRATSTGMPLAVEDIVRIVEQHLSQPYASRLPVLVVAAAYHTAAENLGERLLPLASHNAADSQTRAVGDLQITLAADSQVVTAYEMKTRRVTRDDIDHALRKIVDAQKLDNYVFITTEPITEEVRDYAASLYAASGGSEIVVLDCISFLRHFLHLFHRLRSTYIETYQTLVMAEPESAVSQPLKEVLLTLRHAAESRLE